MWQIHFYNVAKSFYLDLVDPLPEAPSEGDVEVQDFRNRRR